MIMVLGLSCERRGTEVRLGRAIAVLMAEGPFLGGF